MNVLVFFLKKPKTQNPSRLNWINLQVDFKNEVWIGIGITANKFYMKI